MNSWTSLPHSLKGRDPWENKASANNVSGWHEVLLGREVQGDWNYEEEGERTISPRGRCHT